MMRSARFPLVLSVLALLGLSAPALQAQAAASAEKKEADTPAPKRSRAISGEVAAALSAAMPKYDPPKAVEPPPEEELADLRETDRPRNKIIRLPEYVVQEKKPPVFTDRDLRSTADRATKLFPGLNLSGLNKNVAGEMLWEQERKENMLAFADLASVGSAANPEQQRYYKKLSNETYIRSNEAVDDTGATGTSYGLRKAK